MQENIVHISSDLEALLPRYLKNRQTDLETLQGAFQAGNLEQIRSIGHTLKGSGASFGLDAISAFGRSLEEAAIAHDGTQLQTTLDNLATFLATLKIIFVEEES